jgi:hypothetical protein
MDFQKTASAPPGLEVKDAAGMCPTVNFQRTASDLSFVSNYIKVARTPEIVKLLLILC